MRTFSAKAETVERDWLVIDANDIPLGRLATRVATILMGKHKPIFTPHVDTGDNVIVINAATVKATGNKENLKVYYHHTGHIGGIKAKTLKDMRKENPTKIIELAVKRMLPKGPLGRDMFSKLRVYAGAEHKQQAQQPKTIEMS